MRSIMELLNLSKPNPKKRTPGNMAKRQLRRCFNTSHGYTVAGFDTQEYKRIKAANKDPMWSRNPKYGSDRHLKRLIISGIVSSMRPEW